VTSENAGGDIQLINAQGLVSPLGHYSHVSIGAGVAYISGQLVDNRHEFDEIYSAWIGSHRPARTVAGLKQLHYGAAAEIEAIAPLRLS
jgi:enamine deaminase RidA (YjgF/YER057c/UK114 family)